VRFHLDLDEEMSKGAPATASQVEVEETGENGAPVSVEPSAVAPADGKTAEPSAGATPAKTESAAEQAKTVRDKKNPDTGRNKTAGKKSSGPEKTNAKNAKSRKNSKSRKAD
jgi:hypothetical protein